MSHRSTYFMMLLLVVAGALAFRLPRLADRPMHADESVQAEIFRRLWQRGDYTYNPDEFHGPTLPYATLPVVWLTQPGSFAETNEATCRIVPALFAAAAILLIWLLADALGKPASLVAAVLLAISTAMVFYSRYYIHETLLVFFTLAAIGAGWRYLQSGRWAWCLAAGGCVGLMQATKETAVLTYLAMGAAIPLAWVWGVLIRNKGGRDVSRLPWRRLAVGAAVAAMVAVLVAVTLLTSFFTNLQGAVDGVLAYRPWLSRAGGASPHVHPWHYYLRILAWWRVGDGPVWSEGLILVLAAVGFAASLFPRGRLLGDANVPFVRWLGFTTLLLMAGYSAIPYKTPWCLLGMLLGMILLAGVGAVALVRAVPTRPLKGLLILVLLGAAAQSGRQSYRASYELADDPRNPYVYAHTLADVERLACDVEQIAESSPDGRHVPVRVIWQDAYYWPLPWYLRRMEDVEFRTELRDEDLSAPMVIASPEFDAALEAKYGEDRAMPGYYAIRPQVFGGLWVRRDLWEAHLRRTGRL